MAPANEEKPPLDQESLDEILGHLRSAEQRLKKAPSERSPEAETRLDNVQKKIDLLRSLKRLS